MRFLLILLICFIPGMLKSQHVHFIYIQSDQQQPFYVKKSGEIISSSTTGFVILPKLPSGTHQFVIGFPKNQWPEYDFQVEVRSSDRGFTLKNFDEKGWGLFDLQSAEVISGRRIDPPKAQEIPEAPKSNDPFSVILASAVGDEGIRETGLIAMTVSRQGPVASKTTNIAPTVAKKDVQPETPKPVSLPQPTEDKTVAVVSPPVEQKKKTEVEAAVKTASPEPTAEVPPAIKAAPPLAKAELPPDVKTQSSAPPKSEVKSELPAVVKNETPPVKAQSLPELKPVDTKQAGSVSMIRKISEVRGTKITELLFVDMNGTVSDTVDVVIEINEAETKVPASGGNAATAATTNRINCTDIATEKDAMSLRRKVLGMGGDEEMMAAILKEVKAKCYTTESLQNLSYVFVNDGLRYRLFEESYPYIYDPANYGTLERLLYNEEYISRFRKLIKIN
jgi:hypothetical protein